MSESTLPNCPASTDRNLLLGVLALETELIGRDDLIRAMSTWVREKQKSLSQILAEQGALATEQRSFLENLVAEHLRQHNDDPHRSLAAVRSLGSVREDLERLADADVQASMALVSTTCVNDDCAPTVCPTGVGTATPAGSRFRILRPHAQGGLGRVHVAQDEELHREVALKDIQDRYADDPHSRARFLREAEITGRLEHPGIVPVYGLGTYADGRPYYAMRFIRGKTLQDAIDAFHRAEQPGRDPGERSLAFRGLLGRYVDVCQAIAYAHSRGILHRDLKPGNILLGQYGETLVVDWGLAKPVAQTEAVSPDSEGPLLPSSGGDLVATQAGQLLGTPAYMSPEQAEGRLGSLGPPSDVYSLGAILYTLVTGRAPVQGKSQAEILQRVIRGEWLRPGQVKKDVPPALEAIACKAMAAEPEHRYGTAAEVADEVQRWLADEPIRAHPEPFPARLARWGRRHRVLVASAAALLLTAVVGLGIGLIAVNQEKRRTQDALDRVSESQARETQSRRRARQAMDALSQDVIADWLARHEQLDEGQRRFLENALAYYEGFAEETGQSEEERAGVAEAHLRVGKIRYRLGDHQIAETTYRRGQALLAQLVGDFPTTPRYRKLLAGSHHDLGNILADTGRLADAEQAYGEALSMRRQLAADFPAPAVHRRDLAETEMGLANLLERTSRPQQAAAAYGEALAIYRQLAADFPADLESRRGLAHTEYNLAGLLRKTSRLREAETAYQDALAVFKKLATDFPAVSEYQQDLAGGHDALAGLLGETGRPRQAEAAYRDALALARQLAATYPASPDHQRRLAQVSTNLGRLLAHSGSLAEAEAADREALAIFKHLAAAFPRVTAYRRDLASSQNILANLLVSTGRAQEAETIYRDALATLKQLANDFPTVTKYRQSMASIHYNLGNVFRKTRPREAEKAYRDALAIFQQLVADFPLVAEHRYELAVSLNNLANVLADTGRAREAEAMRREAVALFKRLVADFPTLRAYQQDLVTSQHTLALLFAKTGRLREAETTYGEALAVSKKLCTDFPTVPDYHNRTAGLLVDLADFFETRKDFSHALQALEEARPHHELALKANPRNATYRLFFRNQLWHHSATLLGLGDHAAAADRAEQLARFAYDPASDEYDAACLVAQCVPLVEKDSKLPEARRKELANNYADRAMAVLRRAVTHGRKDVGEMKKDTDLDSLRKRPDFQKLLAELESPKRPAR